MKNKIFILLVLINCNFVRSQRYLKNLNPQLFGNVGGGNAGVKTFSNTKSVKTSGYNTYSGYSHGSPSYKGMDHGTTGMSMSFGHGNAGLNFGYGGGGTTSLKTAESDAKYKGGCAEKPKNPLNSSMKCSQYSGCRANCIDNYQFPNGETQLFITCENGEWRVKGTDWDTLPPCEPICFPQCQNNGICIAPNQCHCPDNFNGPQCQYENKPCFNLPPMPMNAKRACRSTSCTITCLSGHKFPDGSSIANMICKGGNWVPAREDWKFVPDCGATCSPQCQNGGICLSYNVCQCPSDFRGPQCQFSTDACNARKLMFNGGYNCSGNSESYSCSLNCPEGVPFEFQAAPVYTCQYSTGEFVPSPIPQCVFSDNMQVINLGGQPHTTYQVFNKSASHGVNTGNFAGYTGIGIDGTYTQNIPNNYYDVTLRPPMNDTIQFVPIGSQNHMNLDAKPGSCFTWGGNHFKTFDGKIFSFHSKCAHTLVRDAVDNTFSIVVQNNKDCDKYIYACSRIIKFYLHDQEFTLKLSESGVPVFATPKKVLPIPAQLPGIRVEMAAHYIIVSLDTIGTKLKWDGEYMVQVEVKENMWNRTSGLCGRFDGNFNNDMLTKDGSHPKSIVTLATSWQVDTVGESCNSAPTEEHVCTDVKIKGTKGTKATQFCKKILSDKRFAPCRNVMDTSLLLDTCRWDYCACKDTDPTTCACNTLNVYVRECSHKGIAKVANWRDEDTCPMQCTGGRVYMTCGPKEGQEVCGATVEKPEDGKCEEGCYCPAGTVLHENQCITRDKCPCKFRGKSFIAGSTIPKDCNTCTCADGQWVCTQVNCGARCSAIGDPHYLTFDGKRYDFMGQCSYYLVSADNFTIEAENVPCAGAISEAMNFPVSYSNTLPSCTKAVTIKIKDLTIKLKQNQEIVVNGHELDRIPYLIDGIIIRSASSVFVVVEFPDGVEVWWDGITRVYVDVPPHYKGKTKGLCGTFNENQKDDFLTPDDDVEQGVIPFANKWKTKENCVDLPDVVKTHPCDINIQNKAKAEEHCKKIKSNIFADCHWMVDPEPYYQDCLYDMCSCETKLSQCLCPMIAAYAQECALKGVKVDWRDDIKECGIHCPGGQKYQVCGNSCTRTCYDISTRPDCKRHCVEGCNCPEGETLDEHGECIPIGRCGCQYEGIDFPAGYKEVRPASKGLDLCTCVNAMWNCRKALSTDSDDYPRANDIKGKCSAKDNLEFTSCEPIEPKTCKNMHSYHPSSNKVCHPGCKCKKGYVLDTYSRKCVQAKDCPCHHGGKSYKEGYSVQHDCNTCKCSKGKWKCTDRPCTAECSAWGDSHFKTFDGKLFDYQGQCDYVLAKGSLGSDSFDITIQNVPCGSLGVACSKSLTVKIGDEVVTLTRGKHLPAYQLLKRITVREKDLFVILEAPDLGIVVHWDKGTRVYVKLNPRWQNKVKGLCGNFNDNEMDDFQTPSGGIPEVSARLFGDSWKLQSYCPDALEIVDTCEERPDRRVWALKKCGMLKSEVFAACHSEVPVENYFDRCVFDSCACDQGGDCECLCTALAAYAQECNNKGVPIKWRSQELCPIQCDEHCAKYSPCVSTCPIETCENFLTHSPLNKLCKEDACIEGCQPKACPPDHVFLNSSLSDCVPRNICKPVCLQIDDTTYFEGDLIDEDECHTCYCSRGKKVCKGSPCMTSTIPPAEIGQLEQLALCRPGWSSWINQDVAPSKGPNEVPLKKDDVEPLPDTIIMNNQNGTGRCAVHQMVSIECRTVKDHVPAKDTGLDVECSLEKGLICNSKNGNYDCEDFEIRVLCGCDIIEIAQVAAEGTECPPGQVYDDCAIECDNLCSFYTYIVHQKGLCKNNTKCQAACVSELKEKSCPSGTKWSNDHTCTKEHDCVCVTPLGIPIKPGTLFKASECEICQCIDNEITCDTSTCEEGYESIMIPHQESEEEDYLLEELEGILFDNTSHVVIVSTMTPPALCDEDRYINLIQGDQPLPDEAFTATSSLGKLYAPYNAKLKTNVSEKSAGSWSPSKSNKRQHLQIDLGRVEPVYGVIVQGSPLYNDYVTSYFVLYSLDGSTFHVITNKNNKPKKFRGPADTINPVKVIFDNPIEAKVIRINPRTWNNAIALKVELIGCGELATTTTTQRPILCTDPMGIGDGMMADQQVSVSSEFGPNVGKKQILIDGPSAWQPLSNTPTEWIQFNFLEPRNITGLVTQGGPNGWVKTYKVSYSNDAKQWNPIVDRHQNGKIFPGNVDKNTPQTNYFYMPIQTTYLKVVPLKWDKNIQLRIEPHGCFEPYPTLPEVLTTARPSHCNYCPGVEPIELELEACRCSEEQWWDGENCVARKLCPCMVGHIPYAVGTIYEKEDCSQCICKIGGISHCTPKACDKCDKGLRSVVTSTCGCICQPCDDSTILCPTSNICINSTLWCNGVQDCPDDELNCVTTPEIIETTEPTTPEPQQKCPPVSCPPGYKVLDKKVDKKKRPYLKTMFSTYNSKDGSHYTPSKTVGVKGVKGGNRKTLKKPVLAAKEEKIVDKECPQFQCVSVRPPPNYLTGSAKPCPPVKCPPGYTPEYNQLDLAKKHTCPKYECKPPPLPDVICNVTGRTFNTFDKTEYKYDICNHVLARDLENDEWEVSLKKTCDDAKICARDLVIHHEDHVIEFHPDLTVNYDGFKYTVDQTKKIGSHSKAFSVSRLGDMLLFVSNRYGFWVMWDKQGNVKVGVTQKLITKVDGLCGYYNDNPDDDKRKPDGTPGRTTVEFGDSWALGDQPAICQTKACPMHIQNKAWDMCNQVKQETFSPCAKVVDVEAFVSRCLETACDCLEAAESNKTTDDQCRCQTLTNFVTDCLTADSELELMDWRTQNDCPVECKAPLIHHDCYRRKCEPTCGTIGDPAACPKIPNVCFPGCYCPPGYVKKGETCIKSADCRDCECNVLPHLQYVTYDETNFTVNANCVYVMSRDVLTNGNPQHKFQVLITNHPCENKPNKMCVGKVTILYKGHKIHVIRHDDGHKLQMIVDSEVIDDFDKIKDLARVKITGSKHFKIYFDMIQVQVNVYYPSLGTAVKSPSHKYRGKLEGLCGDCNKDAGNDLTMPNGKLAEDVDELATSWLYDGIIGQSKETCSNKPKPKCDFTVDNDPCLILRDAGRFGQCHPLLEPSMFIEWCQNDVCGTEVNQACNAISAYARECLNAGFCVQWHSDLCPAQTCPAGQVFEQCGSSCPKTCDSLKEEKKCKETPTEGCFCPEGLYYSNGTCLEKEQCEVCDLAGHHSGDVWKEDACTTCYCFGTSLVCEALTCPAVETVCEPGFTPVKMPADKGECCDKYICAPAATISPTCEAPQKLNCAPGQVMKLDTKADGCKQFICQCKPIEECEPVDTTPPGEDGMVKEIDNSGCCPQEKLICKPELCSAPEECPMFYELKNTTINGKCCPIYSCQAPDKCIFDSEYTASEKGGERLKNQYERQKLLKAANETWKDGPCRECKCYGDKNKGYHSSCSVQECPDINSLRDAKDFVLKPDFVVNQCCPNIKRVACIYEGKTYEIGQKWHPKDDFCTTIECVSTESGIQKNVQVTTCDTNCDIGWLYTAAAPHSMECCGSCAQIACVSDGEVRRIGEEWSSPDHCSNYVCSSVNGTLQVQATVVNCPEISKESLKDFVYETKVVDGKCCKEHKVVACKVGDKEHKIGDVWPSPDGDLCKKITCVKNGLGEITKQELVETCHKNCSKGWEYRESNTTCCGECVQVACVVNDELKKPGENWTSTDTCTTYICEMTDDHQFSVSSFAESCPNVDECPEENIYIKGCCKYCNVTSLPMTNCVPQDIHPSKTVGLIKVTDLKHGECVNKEPINGFTECVGNCHSSTYFNGKTGIHESVCSCCRATKYEPLIVELDCANGNTLEKQIAMPSKCSCEGCTATQKSANTHFTKTGVKTG